jgi:hypothetical protein
LLKVALNTITLTLALKYEILVKVRWKILTKWCFWSWIKKLKLNNISVISWRSVLFVEETGVPRISHRPVTSQWETLSHNIVLSTPRHEWDSNSPL